MDYENQDPAEWDPEELNLAKSRDSEDSRGIYTYDESAGTGTFAYLLDSEVFAQHHDFQSRHQGPYHRPRGPLVLRRLWP